MKFTYLPSSVNENISVGATIEDLKSSGTDFEWYPTTSKMIQACIDDALTADHCDKARSILDVGAGDGRVLKAFKDTGKFGLVSCLGIEKSPNHVARWSSDYTFIGGDFFENDISGHNVGIIFSNPPYGEYERWATQLIKSSFASVTYLVLPSRWAKSQSIENALNLRDLYATVILSDDFSSADRKARASIDVIRIVSKDYKEDGKRAKFMMQAGMELQPFSFMKRTRDNDPMDAWFKEAFPNISKLEEEDKSLRSESTKEKAYGVFKKTNNIQDLVMLYQLESDRVLSNYKAFDKMDTELFDEMNINLGAIKNLLKQRMARLRNEFWSAFIYNYEPITSRLTKKYQTKIYEQLIDKSRDISVNVTNALIVTQMVINQANTYAEDQVKDFFYELSNPKFITKYKSNQKVFADNNWRYCTDSSNRPNRYTLDYRIIQPCLFRLRVNVVNRFEGYDVNTVLSDICTIARVLGMNVTAENQADSMTKSDVCAGERITVNYRKIGSDEDTELMAIKFFANQNQHVFLSQEFALRLNIYIGKILGWVTSVDDAFEEMAVKGVDKETFVKAFNSTSTAPMQFKGSKISGYLETN